MGAYRCAICGINFPRDTQMSECPACGEKTTWRETSDPMENWKDLVAQRVEAHNFHISDEVWTRAERLTKLGVDIVSALSWAETDIDVHDFERQYTKMRAQGCPHETALKILAPLVVS